MKKRRASRYRHSIDIESLDDSTTDQYGAVVENWSSYLTGIRCDIETASGREYYESRKETSDEITRFFIRYDSNFNITTKHRVLFNGQYYDIQYAPNFDFDNNEIILHTIRRGT